MRPLRRAAREQGSIIILLLVVLAALAGGYWFLKMNRDKREKEALAFASEAARRIVFQRDAKFIDFNLTQKAQMQYPPSWRFRMLEFIKDAGVANPEFHFTKAEMLFDAQFFDPHGTYIAQFDYPNGPGYLELHISHPGALWVIDDLNWTWQPPPPPPPTPTPIVSPGASLTPSPTSSPTPKPKKK